MMDIVGRYESSPFLYHYTKQVNYIISIIEKGFFPRLNDEDYSFLFPHLGRAYTMVSIPMVCFTDIPIGQNRLTVHTKAYGRYAIGLTKRWAVKNRLNPVHYIVPETIPVKAFQELFTYCDKPSEDERTSKQLQNSLWTLAAYFKVYYSETRPGQEKKIYYNEREWRYVPALLDSEISDTVNYLCGPHIQNMTYRTQITKKMENHPLLFSAEDVTEIIVRSEDERRKVIEAISKMDRFPLEDKKSLSEKIVNVDNDVL